MQIRSITCFIDPSGPLSPSQLDTSGKFLQAALPALSNAGYTVQSARLAIVPFPNILTDHTPGGLSRLARKLEQDAASLGFAYVSVGPALPDQLDTYDAIPGALSATQNVFFAGSMTTPGGDISLGAIHKCAEIIQQASTISPDGFANLRFAALSNVPPGSPFFPAAYHQGGRAAFAFATEAADLAVSAFTRAHSLKEAREHLVTSMETHGHALEELARVIEHQTGVKFIGIDFSLAPFPEDNRSVGSALEHLGVSHLGSHGSLAAAAILADSMDQAQFTRAGFSGLMLPVLEDAVLARRAEEEYLSIKDLLLYSAVCGTGLDTLPLPGDTTVEQLSALLLDVASLSARLAKPLTARLMPIPGKKAGDPTGFDFAYFANSRVMSLQAVPLEKCLAGEESFGLKPRQER